MCYLTGMCRVLLHLQRFKHFYYYYIFIDFFSPFNLNLVDHQAFPIYNVHNIYVQTLGNKFLLMEYVVCWHPWALNKMKKYLRVCCKVIYVCVCRRIADKFLMIQIGIFIIFLLWGSTAMMLRGINHQKKRKLRY